MITFRILAAAFLGASLFACGGSDPHPGQQGNADGGTAGAGPDGGTTTSPAAPRFPGFENMAFSAGTYWEYSWRENGTTNGRLNPEKSGVLRIQLSNPVDVDIGSAGVVRLFEASYSVKSGIAPTWPWPAWKYFGVKDGVLFIGAKLDSGKYAGATLFDSKTGEIYVQGFMGYFSSKRAESVASASISNPFINAPAVVVDEPFYKPQCETIAGVQVCDDQFHDYQVREYYLPGKGFGGWYRSGTSIFSGGGYVDIFKSTIEVGLTSTNL